jgi:predicted dehydrogenase
MLNAAIVGLGRWGQTLVASAQGKTEKIRFVAGVTGTPAKAETFAKTHGIPLGKDYGAVLKDPKIQAVVLATPHSLHARQVAEAAAAGKHVFVEKPFTLTKATAEQAAAACAKAKVVLAIGHNRRFLPAMVRLKQAIADGQLGTLQHVEATFAAPGGFRYQPGTWRADPDESPAGGMAGLGIHVIDAMIHMFGRIKAVCVNSTRRSVATDVDDTTSMLLWFENGMSGYLGTLMATAPIWRLQVFGAKQWIEMRGQRRLVVGHLEGERDQIEFPVVDIERAELEAFADAATGGAPYPVTAEEAIHGIAVFEAIAKGARTPETIRVA